MEKTTTVTNDYGFGRNDRRGPHRHPKNPPQTPASS